MVIDISRVLSFIMRKTVRKEVSCLLVALLFCIAPLSAYSGGAAPYSKEAADSIEAAGRGIGLPKTGPNTSREELVRKYVEIMRQAFREAGYDYDATMVKIADDLENHEERIPKDNSALIAGYVVAGLQSMMSACNEAKVDCLQLFPPETSRAVRTIMKIAPNPVMGW